MLLKEHLDELHEAKRLLESTSLAQKLTVAIGRPIEAIEAGFESLSPEYAEEIKKISRDTLEKGLQVAVKTLDTTSIVDPSNAMHKFMVMGTGSIGGAFGLKALAIELPLSTAIMLRSIADIARSQGENLEGMEARLACLEVFALGGQSDENDAAKSSYFAVRMLLTHEVVDAARFLANPQVLAQGVRAPALVRLISQIASRFGVVVSQKVAAQALPVIGAIGGAAINTIFIDHFQNMARGHFIVRKLERIYDESTVKQTYDDAGQF